MSICWYCHWGWAKAVAKIYKTALAKLNGDSNPLLFGPAHIVWEEENFDYAELCLEDFEKYRGHYTDAELAIVEWSLEELARLPLGEREIEPDDYDGEHPENYPPPKGVEVEVVKGYSSDPQTIWKPYKNELGG